MQRGDKRYDIQRNLNQSIRLAPLKMNIHLLLQSLADDDLDPDEIAAILHHYPMICARLLGLANSAWVSSATPITNIEAACIRLGTKLIKSVSIAIAVSSVFNASKCPSFDPVKFWTTSMLVAEGAGLLSLKLSNQTDYPRDVKSTVQAAGILHNLGLLWLAENQPAEMEAALQLCMTDKLVRVNQALDEFIGMDYCQVGAWIGKEWRLPDELISIITHHRDDQYQAEFAVQVLLVGAAARMLSMLFHETPDLADYTSLHAFGIDYAAQLEVFAQLTAKFANTQELAKNVFFSS